MRCRRWRSNSTNWFYDVQCSSIYSCCFSKLKSFGRFPFRAKKLPNPLQSGCALSEDTLAKATESTESSACLVQIIPYSTQSACLVQLIPYFFNTIKIPFGTNRCVWSRHHSIEAWAHHQWADFQCSYPWKETQLGKVDQPLSRSARCGVLHCSFEFCKLKSPIQWVYLRWGLTRKPEFYRYSTKVFMFGRNQIKMVYANGIKCSLALMMCFCRRESALK